MASILEKTRYQYEISSHPKNWAAVVFYSSNVYLGEILFSDKVVPGFV